MTKFIQTESNMSLRSIFGGSSRINICKVPHNNKLNADWLCGYTEMKGGGGGGGGVKIFDKFQRSR